MENSNEKVNWFSPLISAAKRAGSAISGWRPPQSSREIKSNKDGTRVMGRALEVIPTIKNYKTNFKMDQRGLYRTTPEGTIDEFFNGKLAKGGAALLRTKASIGGVEVGDDPFIINRPGGSKRIPADKAMGAYAGWVAAATDAIAYDIATIEWRLFEVQDDKDHEEIFDHELLDLLDGVNEFQTGTELRYLMATHLELTGNCYLLKLDKNKKVVSSDSQKPGMLYPLYPGGVMMKFDKTSFPYTLVEYVFKNDGQEHHFKPYQLLHVKYPDPSDMWSGIGSVQKIAAWIDVENYSTEYNRKFFINGAHIDGMLESDMTAEETIDVLRTSWENAYSSVDNAHKTPVLPKGVKYTQTSASPKEMDFAGLSDRSRDRILAGMKVSKTILGTAESDTNRATAETADYVFAKRTIRPKMELILAYFNEFLVPLFSDKIYLSYENPVPEDAEFRTKEMQAAMGSMPVLAVNEAREEYMGLGPVEGGDTVQVSNTMQPVGAARERNSGGGGGRDKPKDEPKEDPQAAEEDNKPEDDNEGDADQAGKGLERRKASTFPRRVIKRHLGGKKTRGAINSAYRRSIGEMLAERVAANLAKQDEQSKKRINELTHEEYETVYKEFLSRVDPYEKKIAELLVEVNKAQKAEVMDNLEKLPGVSKAIDPSDIFNLKKWIDITIEALTPTLTTLGEQEGKAAAELVGKPLQESVFASPEAQNALDESISLLSRSYNETVLKALREKLDAGISQGLGYKELGESVSDIYEWQDQKAALRVARTESVRVANMTTKTAWQQTGVVKSMKWYTANDAEVCVYCDQMDGKVESIDANFFNQGDEIQGSDESTMTADYSDIGGPPLHPNCRCYIRPEDISTD